MYAIEHVGFHGFHALRFSGRLCGNGRSVEVSARVARRLNDEVCGLDDCRCAERAAREEQGRWYVALPDGYPDTIVIRGHYAYGVQS